MSDMKRLAGLSCRVRGAALRVVLGASLAMAASPARANTFTVTNTNASGAGSLPDAVAQANGIAGTHTINITATGTLTLASAIGVGQTMIINGPVGAPGFTIDGGGAAQLVVIQPITSASGPVTLNNLTFSNGHSATSGGAISVSTGTTLNVSTCTFSNNDAVSGGGAIAVGTGATLAVTGSTFSANSMTGSAGPGGGAIWGDTTSVVTLTDSTFTGNSTATNSADSGGGAVSFYGSSLTVRGSTFASNSATAFIGGALFLFGNTGIENSTFTANIATNNGGAIYVGRGAADIRSTTISGNNGGLNGGLYVATFVSPAPTAFLRNSILTANLGHPGANGGADCTGPVTSNGYNIVGDRDPTCSTFDATNISTPTPALGALASNGGPTQTMVPNAGSPAIDAGNPAGCLGLGGSALTVDQRGLARPFGPRCDIGAVEAQTVPPSLTAAFNPATITAGQSSTLTFTITNPAGQAAAVGIAFTNALPAGVVLASAPSASQCGGTVSGTAGGGTLALAGGSIATSPGTCTVIASVTSTVPNTYQELPANVSGLADLTDAGLSASLTVQAGTGPPGLTVSKSAPATVVSGQNLTYTLTYGNSGGAAAPSVVIRDTIPAGTTFVSATNGGTVQGTDVVWNIASVPAGATGLTVSFTVTVTASTGSITNGTYSITSVAGLVTAGGPVVVTLVNLPLSSVPALGPAGFALLALGISGAALVLLRSRA